jgi:hypothetical protein
MSRPWRIRIRRTDRPNCNHLTDQPCDLCAEDRARDMSRPIQKPALQFFGEKVFEHMYHPWEPTPPISSPEVLRQEADKRGLYSKYLQDSLIFKSGPDRWV